MKSTPNKQTIKAESRLYSDLFEGFMIARNMFVQHVSFAKALAAELAVVGVHVGEVDVLNVLIGRASVLECLAAEPAPETELAATWLTALHVLGET
jgi:hypothetical protein